MSDQIQRFFDELKIIRYVARDLEELGSSFKNTGNPVMAETLWNRSETLLESHDKLRGIHGEMINDGAKAAQENTKTIIEAVFAGKTLAEREKGN